MQSTKKLTSVLRDLVLLLDEEAARNPAFAASLDAVLAGLPPRVGNSSRQSGKARTLPPAPDVFAALQDKGESEFRFWIRDLDIPTLKAVIKRNGFDPGKLSQRWSDRDKFVNLVVEQTIARMKRGSAFLPPKGSDQNETKPD